jgi:hypothetical protein
MRPPFTQTVRLLLCLLLASPDTFAQTKDTSLRKLYAYAGGGAATRQGYSGGLGVQAVWKNNWTTTLSYHHVGMNPKNLPKDYKPGLFFAIPDGYPEAVLRVYSLSAGKYIAAGGKAWLTTEAGVSYVQGEEFTFQRQSTDGGGWFYTPSNYSSTTKDVSGFGVLLKADFTWAFSSFAGLGAEVYADINSVQSPLGVELKLLVGWMNRKK